jgi:hypothetical protein
MIYYSGNCVCNAGFFGNGRDCRSICALDEMFDDGSCIKTNVGGDPEEEGNILIDSN